MEPSNARVPWLLALGAAIGLALAASGLLEAPDESAAATGEGALDSGVAAVVGERVIRRVDYERVLAGVASDLKSPIDDALRRRVLERMIDEELLVRRGIDLGLAASDRRVRGELVSSLVDSVVAEAAGDVPSPADVERHYRENLDFFTPPSRVHVGSLFFAGPSASERAERARDALAQGADAEDVARELADPELAPVPDALLPLAKLRDYLGPEVVAALATQGPGSFSEPIATAGGFRIVRVIEREAGTPPPLESIAELVEQDLVRRRGDEALRRYLDRLREEVPTQRNAALFGPDSMTTSAGSAPSTEAAAASRASAAADPGARRP